MQPFLQVKDDLTIEDGIILQGSGIFILPRFREFILDEFYSAHHGVTAIKSLARSYVWWPGIDRDLELKVNKCVICQ